MRRSATTLLTVLPAFFALPAAAQQPLAAQEPAGCGLYEAAEPGDTLALVAARCGIEESLLEALNPDLGADAGGLQVRDVIVLDWQGLDASDDVAQAPRPYYLAHLVGLWRGAGS